MPSTRTQKHLYHHKHKELALQYIKTILQNNNHSMNIIQNDQPNYTKENVPPPKKKTTCTYFDKETRIILDYSKAKVCKQISELSTQ
jgi:hypothetical protein